MKKILSAIIVAMLLMTLTMSAFAATGLGSYTTVTVSPAVSVDSSALICFRSFSQPSAINRLYVGSSAFQ